MHRDRVHEWHQPSPPRPILRRENRPLYPIESVLFVFDSARHSCSLLAHLHLESILEESNDSFLITLSSRYVVTNISSSQPYPIHLSGQAFLVNCSSKAMPFLLIFIQILLITQSNLLFWIFINIGGQLKALLVKGFIRYNLSSIVSGR